MTAYSAAEGDGYIVKTWPGSLSSSLLVLDVDLSHQSSVAVLVSCTAEADLFLEAGICTKARTAQHS